MLDKEVMLRWLMTYFRFDPQRLANDSRDTSLLCWYVYEYVFNHDAINQNLFLWIIPALKGSDCQ